jgi:hypothetical protein
VCEETVLSGAFGMQPFLLFEYLREKATTITNIGIEKHIMRSLKRYQPIRIINSHPKTMS